MEAQVITALESCEVSFREALGKRNAQLEVAKKEIVRLAEATVQCGVFAREMETIIGQQKFPLWFAERGFDCSVAAAKSFMRFAEKRQELSDNFRRTLLSLPGVCESQAREDGSQQRRNPAKCEWLASLMRATGCLNAAIEKAPLASWPESQLITLADSLRFFVELAEKVEALCAD